MDPNSFDVIDGLTSGMTDYRPYCNPDSSYLNNHASGNINGRGHLGGPFVSESQSRATNTYTMPASSMLYQTSTHAYQDHQHNQAQDERATPQFLDQRFYQHLGPEHPQVGFNSSANQSFLLSELPMQPPTKQYDSSLLSRDFNPFNGFQNFSMIPPTVPRVQGTQGVRFWTGEPYAKLIYEALKMAPNHQMVLRDIYSWFQHNTDKSQASNGSGWKNSIRHNLSMNGAFHKVDVRKEANNGKKSYIWALTKRALAANGVESTTRYRKNVARKSATSQAQYRVSKSARPSSSGNKLSHRGDIILQHMQDNNALVVKEERKSYDLSAPTQHSSSIWPTQDNAGQYQLPYEQNPFPWHTTTIEGQSDIVISEVNVFPGFAALAPPFQFEQQIAYVPTQQNTPAGTQENTSPTPSMTVTISSFGHHEDNEFERYPQFIDLENVQHNHGYPPHKHLESVGPFIYNEEDVAPTIEN